MLNPSSPLLRSCEHWFPHLAWSEYICSSGLVGVHFGVQCWLGADKAVACAGRVLVACGQKTTVTVGSVKQQSMQYFINVYQHTSDKPELQQTLLEA
eukprot:498598-Rhodomonas_salina.1